MHETTRVALLLRGVVAARDQGAVAGSTVFRACQCYPQGTLPPQAPTQTHLQPFSPEAIARAENLLTTFIRTTHLDLTYTLLQTSSQLGVLFTGPDTRYLLARNAELLFALEYLIAKITHLEPDQHDRIDLDADGFKAQRDRAIQVHARQAITHVRTTGQPFHFRPMNSRERRLLHLALAGSGLESRSEGEGPERHLILHPSEHPSS